MRRKTTKARVGFVLTAALRFMPIALAMNVLCAGRGARNSSAEINMKIIAKTSTGYLVEATGLELANAAGYNHPSEAPGFKPNNSYSSYSGSFPIGTEFKPTETFDYLQN